MQKQGRFDHFNEDTGCKSWFFRMSVGTKLKCALNNTSPNSKNTQPKTKKMHSLRATFPLKELLFTHFTSQNYYMRPCKKWVSYGGRCVEKILAPKSKYIDMSKPGSKKLSLS